LIFLFSNNDFLIVLAEEACFEILSEVDEFISLGFLKLSDCLDFIPPVNEIYILGTDSTTTTPEEEGLGFSLR
jgi:hypothetical protein